MAADEALKILSDNSVRDLLVLSRALDELPTAEVVALLGRVSAKRRALLFRLLPKGRAFAVFESLDARLTGGNIGSQAATTLTRALALHEVRPRDLVRVAFRELRVGVLLGATLGLLGCIPAAILVGPEIALVLLLLAVTCIGAVAATAGGAIRSQHGPRKWTRRSCRHRSSARSSTHPA